MAKFYKRRFHRSGARDKYSVESTTIRTTTGGQIIAGVYQATANVVPASPTQGMRKVKHLTISLTTVDGVTALFWALVYVPEGYSVNPLNTNPGASLYEPNQFVLNSGIVDPSAGPIRISSPLSRNLNSGDSIWLVVGTGSTGNEVSGVVRYAITLQ